MNKRGKVVVYSLVLFVVSVVLAQIIFLTLSGLLGFSLLLVAMAQTTCAVALTLEEAVWKNTHADKWKLWLLLACPWFAILGAFIDFNDFRESA